MRSVSRLYRYHSRMQQISQQCHDNVTTIIAQLSRPRRARSGAPWVRKFGYLCIQEILVLTKSSVRRTYVHPFMLADVKWHTYQLGVKAFKSGIWHPCCGQLIAVKEPIRWPVSHDCVADSGIQLIEVKNFLNLSADKFLVSIDRDPRFISGIQFAYYLRQRLSYLRKTFLKRSLEGCAFGLG